LKIENVIPGTVNLASGRDFAGGGFEQPRRDTDAVTRALITTAHEPTRVHLGAERGHIRASPQAAKFLLDSLAADYLDGLKALQVGGDGFSEASAQPVYRVIAGEVFKIEHADDRHRGFCRNVGCGCTFDTAQRGRQFRGTAETILRAWAHCRGDASQKT
jgi:hypothetical protein